LYLGDLISIVSEAAYRTDLRWPTSLERVAYWGTPEGTVSLITGSRTGVEQRKRKPAAWLGHLNNVNRETMPEYEWLEDVGNPDTGLLFHGWRFLVIKWLRTKVIRPTPAVVELLGESECCRQQIAV
jgi:hypothetical protein